MTRPHVTCLMISSIDGRLHPSRYTHSPDGTADQWSGAYEALHDELSADAWLVGRTTMAEMAKGDVHPPKGGGSPVRPLHIAERKGPFAVATDRSGKLHFANSAIGGDHVIVLLGSDVADGHLAELTGDGISYLVAGDEEMSMGPLLETLGREFGIRTLLLEGGGGVNGSFLAAGLVDELYVILAPALDGSPSTAIVEAGEAGLKGKVTLSLLACDRLEGGAIRLHYAVKPDIQ